MLVGDGGNIGLSVGDDGALIIDTQYAPLRRKDPGGRRRGRRRR